ncbi:MAG: hypothetical protein LUG99_00485 [Lachnospiraceae bacterium]|nr:hypothetical protein [Lachnospiraceae bacterium]
MIEAGTISYTVVAFTSAGVQLNITQAVKDLGWEEGEDELALKMTFKMYNASYNGTKLSKLLGIGSVVAVKAKWDGGKEIVQCSITECERTTSKSDEVFDVTAYDCLYNLQKSQDNVYFSKGKKTKSAIKSVFSSWGITLSSYNGPNVAHSKIVYKNTYLGDIIRGILDDAKKKGGCSAIVRSTKGKVSIVKVGSNSTVYRFEKSNAISSKHKVSIADLVTRVKVVSSEDDSDRTKVEAVVNGKTSYGIFQRIYNYSGSDSLSEAKEAAQEILDEKGEPEETSTVEAPDVPAVRKGDKVNLKLGALNGNYVVKSIQHDATSGKMTMEVEKYKSSGSSIDDDGDSTKSYSVGDKVTFNGGKHYVSSYAGATGYTVSAGPAKISKINKSGAHPYCLVTTDWSKTHVYGWVDEGTFT